MSHSQQPIPPRTPSPATSAAPESTPTAPRSARSRHAKPRSFGRMSTAALDAMPDAAFLYDTDGSILYANSTARALFALDAQPGFERIPIEERVKRIAPRMRDGQPLPREQWHVTRLLRGEVITSTDPVAAFVTSLDGRELFLSYTGAPIRDAAGHLIGAIAVGRDLLERQRQRTARQAAQAERQRLEAAAQRAA